MLVRITDVDAVMTQRTWRADDVHACRGQLNTYPADGKLDAVIAKGYAFAAVHGLPYGFVGILAIDDPLLESVREEHGIAELVKSRRIRPVLKTSPLEHERDVAIIGLDPAEISRLDREAHEETTTAESINRNIRYLGARYLGSVCSAHHHERLEGGPVSCVVIANNGCRKHALELVEQERPDGRAYAAWQRVFVGGVTVGSLE